MCHAVADLRWIFEFVKRKKNYVTADTGSEINWKNSKQNSEKLWREFFWKNYFEK